MLNTATNRQVGSKPSRPAVKLAFGRASIRVGREYGDPELMRLGQRLVDEANAELDAAFGKARLFSAQAAYRCRTEKRLTTRRTHAQLRRPHNG